MKECWQGDSIGLFYYFCWILYFQVVLNLDYEIYFLLFFLFKLNVIRKFVFFDFCGVWLEGKFKYYMEKLFLVIESNGIVFVFKDVGFKWQRE